MNALFDIAESSGIEVIYRDVPVCQSISMPGYICLDYGLLWGGASERVHLAHELGHCETGSFYNRHSPCDLRQKHERRADKWAILTLIPEETLKRKISAGYTEPWDLAEQFNVTEEFMRKALAYYRDHGLYSFTDM